MSARQLVLDGQIYSEVRKHLSPRQWDELFCKGEITACALLALLPKIEGDKYSRLLDKIILRKDLNSICTKFEELMVIIFLLSQLKVQKFPSAIRIEKTIELDVSFVRTLVQLENDIDFVNVVNNLFPQLFFLIGRMTYDSEVVNSEFQSNFAIFDVNVYPGILKELVAIFYCYMLHSLEKIYPLYPCKQPSGNL